MSTPKITKKLLWSENFKGEQGRVPTIEYHDDKVSGKKSRRKTNWSIDFGDGSDSGAGAGWGNNEKEFYTDEAVTQDGAEDGNLVVGDLVRKVPAAERR
jgi:hypothetical protein